MTGFRIPKRTALVTFEGTEWDGLEIRLRLNVPLGKLFAFQSLGSEGEEGYKRFGDDVLEGWNLVDENGGPVPANGVGILTLPPALIALVMRRWTEVITDVPGPLGGPSTAGAPSVVPMTPAGIS